MVYKDNWPVIAAVVAGLFLYLPVSSEVVVGAALLWIGLTLACIGQVDLVTVPARSFLFSVAVGMVLSCSVHLANDAVFARNLSISSYFRENEVVAFDAILTGDSIVNSGGFTLIPIRVTNVRGDGDNTSSTNLRGTVWYNRPQQYYWGQQLQFSGSLGNGGLFFASRIADYPTPEENSLMNVSWYVLRWRSLVLQSIKDKKVTFLRQDTKGLVYGLLLGDQDLLSPSLKNQFKTNGILHLLAMSGMHIGVIGGLVFFITNKVISRYKALTITLLVLLLFVFLAGVSPSLLRAIVAYGMVVYFMRNGQVENVRWVVPFSFMVLVLTISQSVYSISFQLSFLAVSGIFLLFKPWFVVLRKYLPPWLAASFAVSVAAMTGSCLYTASVLDSFVPWSIGISILLTPIIILFMALSIPVLWFSIPPLEYLLNQLYFVLEKIVEVHSVFLDHMATLLNFPANKFIPALLFFILGLSVPLIFYFRNKVLLDELRLH